MRCDRCGQEMSAFVTSYFNTDTICMECEELEEKHPAYPAAKEAERQALIGGDMNFPGVGLPKGYKLWAKVQKDPNGPYDDVSCPPDLNLS